MVILLILIVILLISLNFVNASDVNNSTFILSDATISVNDIDMDVGVCIVNTSDDVNLNETGLAINSNSGSNLNILTSNNTSEGNPNICVEDLNNQVLTDNVTDFNGINGSSIINGNNSFNISTDGTGHFIINNGSSQIKYYIFNVNNESDLKYISSYISDLKNRDDIIIVNFAQDILCTGSESNVFFISSRKVMIMGNGYTIYSKNHNQFITLDLLSNVELDNLIISGFNNPINNYGTLFLNHVICVNNTGDIINSYGTLEAVLCDFNNNKVINGVVVPHDSVVSLTNCSFDNNVLNKSNSICVDIYVDDGSTVNVYLLDGFNQKPITKCYNEGRVTFRNTSDSSIANLTVDAISGHDIISIANQVYNDNGKNDIIIVNLWANTTYNVNIENYSLFHPRKGVLIINGNGAIINLNNFKINGDKHFLICEKDVTVIVNNLTIRSFNSAIINYGDVILNNVVLDSNKVDYWFDDDYGGAIRNYATLTCTDCNFTNNFAEDGGAIYTSGPNSKVNLTNCYFRGNHADDDGNSVYICNGGELYIYNLGSFYSDIDINQDDEFNRIFRRNSSEPVVKEFVVNDSDSLRKAVSAIWNDNFASDMFIVNVSSIININPWSSYLFHPRYGKLIINGYNSTIYVNDAKDDDEYHFAYVEPWVQLEVYGLRIAGFNGAIHNYGYTYLEGVNFLNNKVDYWFDNDACGAIYNYGLLYCTGCSFINNEGEDANIVFNDEGALSYFINCSFSNCSEDIVNILNFDGGNSILINANSDATAIIDVDESVGAWASFGYHLATYALSAAVGIAFACVGKPELGFFLAALIVGGVTGGVAELAVDIAIAKHNHDYDATIFRNAPLYVLMHALDTCLWYSLIGSITGAVTKTVTVPASEASVEITEVEDMGLHGWKKVMPVNNKEVIPLDCITEGNAITSDSYINKLLYDFKGFIVNKVKNIVTLSYIHTGSHVELIISDYTGRGFFLTMFQDQIVEFSTLIMV